MILFLVALVAVVIAQMWFRDRENRRMIDAMQTAAAAQHKEVQMLLQRIQAPEAAVIQHQVEANAPGEVHYPLSDEESAREQATAFLTRVEDMERYEAQVTNYG